MSYSNDIKILLGIKDNSVSITKVENSSMDGNKVTIIHGILTKDISHCSHCHCESSTDGKKMIVRNGTKASLILMNKTAIHKAYLRLKKQRFHCRHCQTHFTCETTVVAPHCFISRQVKLTILEALACKQSAASIAKSCYVSWSTVKQIIHSLIPYVNRKKEWLPTCLMVDEFRSMKSAEGKMAFICADGDSGELFDILPSRRLDYIASHFNSFTLESRMRVQFIVTDMNAPYFELVKRCFPNAKVVVDRFHIVQHLNRSFNQLRIRIMKSLNHNDPVQARHYRQLKSLYKLLLKRSSDLDYKDYHKWGNFKWEYLRETDVVHRLLSISNELKHAYLYYQDLLDSFKNSEADSFFHAISHMPTDLPSELKHIRKAFLKYEKGIRLAMELTYSNGKIESKNTHIKTLKRVSYGFKNFTNMKVRIFLQNNLIRFN